ncbi:MAG TPA: hypothetical protein DCE71_08200 [Parachlamydiales bacterium]|nr:hypothetical protein [Parachlamydiales bacterium]
MRFVLLLFCFTQAFAAAIVREKTSDGSWLEARINDDRTLGGLIFSDGSSVIYDYEDARLQKITRLDSLGREIYSQSCTWKTLDLRIKRHGLIRNTFTMTVAGSLHD